MAARFPRLDTDRPSVVLEPWSRDHKQGLLAAADDVGLRFEGVAVDGYRKHGELFDRQQYGLARRHWTPE